MASLPRFMVLKSTNTNKYLRYRKEEDSNHAFLEFSQDEKQENPEFRYMKFEIQKSETVEGFVHIRSCYNNRYWMRKSGDETSHKWMIAAEANEPENDPSKSSCTLFKPVYEDVVVDADTDTDIDVVVEVKGYKVAKAKKPQKIRLVHIDELGEQGCIALPNSDLLALQPTESRGADSDSENVFIAYDVSLMVGLPEHIALAANTGEYGAVTILDGKARLQFKTNDIGSLGVTHEAHDMGWIPALGRSLYRIRNRSAGWWFNNYDGTMYMADPSSSNGGMPITPLTLGGSQMALHENSAFQHMFFHSTRDLGMERILRCDAPTINESAIFEVVEPVLARKVSNMEYNLADARTYNISSLEKFKDERENYSDVEQTGSFGVEYTESNTTSWGDSVSITSSITASMSVSIPYVGIGFGVELSEERNRTVEFGKEQSEEKTVSYMQNLALPPRKKITLLVLATRALCDVPYTCRVIDTLSDGSTQDYIKTGLFTGANEFGFVTRIIPEDL